MDSTWIRMHFVTRRRQSAEAMYVSTCFLHRFIGNLIMSYSNHTVAAASRSVVITISSLITSDNAPPLTLRHVQVSL